MSKFYRELPWDTSNNVENSKIYFWAEQIQVVNIM